MTPWDLYPREIGIPQRQRTPAVALEIPTYAYPIAEAAKKAMDEPPRHDITVRFAPEAVGQCLVCSQKTLSITLVGVPMFSLDALFDRHHGPHMGRLSGHDPRAYRFEPCGCELRR